MFDNSLFATFIPQVLMLLGYLSCVLAPFFSNPAPSLTPEIAVSQNTVIENTQHISVSNESTFAFDDFFQVGELITDSQQNFLHNFFINDYDTPKSIGNLLSLLSYRLFSRPPPLF